MTRRMCFALDLIDDDALIADYERAHAAGAGWPEITTAIHAKGVEFMEIWRTGDRLFMIAEVADDWPRPISADLSAADARWEAAMDRFQRPLPHATPDEKWVPMTRIYVMEGE